MTLQFRSRSIRSAVGALLFGALLIPGAALADSWQRIGKRGFAGSYNALQYLPKTFCVFKGKLHSATGDVLGPGGGQIWRYDGSRWTLVFKGASTTPHIHGFSSLAVLGDFLYAGATTNQGTCEVWRTRGAGGPPYTWTKVSGPANVSRQGNYEIPSMVVTGGSLYLGTRSSQGGRIWRFTGGAWTQVVGQGPSSSPTGPGFGNKENTGITSLAVSPAGEIIAGTNRGKGCEVWRNTSSGWVRLNVPGFGNKKHNTGVSALAYLGNALFAMTENSENGCQVLKYLGPGPADWKTIHAGGFRDPRNERVKAAVVFGTPARLYLSVDNYSSGARIFRTNGKTWQAASAPGFGKSDALSMAGGLAVHNGLLYAGAGGEVGGSVYATPGGSKLPHAWTLKNEPGFTKNDNYSADAAAVYRGVLYIGTTNGRGCEVWRRAAGNWKRVAVGGFGDDGNYTVRCMAADNAFLYAGTYNWRTGCEIWRYNGTSWTLMSKPGFGDSRTPEAASMIVYKGRLVVGTSSYDTLGKVWRFDGPGPANWTKMNVNGFGVSHTVGVEALAVFEDQLYAGTNDSNDPCRVWRYDGPGPADWTAVSPEGVSEKSVHAVERLAVYKGSLYAGLWNAKMTGAEVWKYAGSGLSWTRASKNGFGDYKNSSPTSMLVHAGRLYVGTSNGRTGGEIWAFDGQAWIQVNKNGFDITANSAISSLASDGTSLFAGTDNIEKGCEVWVNGQAGGATAEEREDDE